MIYHNIKRRTKSESLKLAYKNNLRLTNNGGNTQRNKDFFISKNELIKLYSVMTKYQIAKKFNMSTNLVSKWLRKYNIKNNKRIGKNNPHWKGGIMFDKERKLIYTPNHPNPDFLKKYVYEYRLIAEKHLGRYLKSGEVIHHINGNSLDNRIENLYVCTQSVHVKIHHKKIECEHGNI